MKKSIKSVLAKSLAVAMAFSLAGIAPGTSADAAAKKPSITKKVTVTAGKTKTVKVTSKKKVKKTTWSLTKKGKKVVSLSKKKAKSVKVKGKKAGKATLTAKIKVGKKTYKKTCKITVKKKDTGKKTATPTKQPGTSTPTASTGTGGTASPSASTGTNPTTSTRPAPAVPPASSFKVDGKTLTVDEASAYRIDLTELNETTYTCDAKKPIGEHAIKADGSEGDEITSNYESISYNRDGSVTFTSDREYNSGVSYYINPCTSEDQLVDISDTRGQGSNGGKYYGYMDGQRDMSGYDYIRVVLKSENEMNFRTYNGNDGMLTSGFKGDNTTETYEGAWKHTDDTSNVLWTAEQSGDPGYISKEFGTAVKEAYVTRTVFIPITDLMDKGSNPETLTALALCPQAGGEEVTIYDIAFVKVAYDQKVTGITVTANKTALDNGKAAACTAAITPKDATRQIVKWTSSNNELATVNYKGQVLAAAEGSGTVTITATSTDGSDVSSSVQITVGEQGEQPAIIETQKVDLTKVKATTNTGSDTIDATQSAEEIAFAPGGNMLFVNMSEILADVDLTEYDQIQVKYQLKNEDGTDADAYEDTPGWANFALVAVGDLNGYTNPGLLKGTAGNLVKDTAVFNLAELKAADAVSAAGFNFQLAKCDADKYIAITDITLYKDNNVNVDLTKVKATTNTGSDTIDATPTAEEIAFAPGGNMLFVNMSEILADVDLTEYTAINVEYSLKNEDGTDADAYEDTPGWANFALVNEGDLNGYTNPGLLKGTTGNLIKDTASFDLSELAASDAVSAAGFNFQLAKCDADKHISITKITIVK